MQNHTYRINPIRAEGALDPEAAEMLKEVPGWSADEWKDVTKAEFSSSSRS